MSFMDIEIQSRIIKTELIGWKKLNFIQQEDFKEWIEEGDRKLLNSLLRYQFIDPFKVWFDGERLWCLDGYHRYSDLLKVEESGIKVPELLPATFINCNDIKNAAELVLVYSSIYAKISQQGLYDFIGKYEIDYSEIKTAIEIPDFSIDRFEQKFDLFDVTGGEEPLVDVKDEEVIVKPGDLFEINGHRIICGSFTDDVTISQLMNGEKARILNCDPPYNLPTNFFSGNKEHSDFAMGAGEMSDNEFVQFLSLIMQKGVENTVPGAIHYIFMDFRHGWHMCEAARQVYGSPIPKQQITWYKDIFANGSFYRAQKELCFIFSDEKEKALWNKDLLDDGGFYKTEDELCFIFKNGEAAKHLSHLELKDRIRTNVWRYPSGASLANPDYKELKNHPTPKPVAMIADSILDTTNENDIVIDWFLGSGTCLIAAEKTNRKCYSTEIEPKYVQSAIQRYINYCSKRDITINFSNLNGKLTLNDFSYERTNALTYD